MNYSEPQKQADAIEFECAGVAREQLVAIATEIAQQHESEIVTEYLKYYCEGFQAQQQAGVDAEISLFVGFEDDEGDRLAKLMTAAFERGSNDASRSLGCFNLPGSEPLSP
ncbi:hypothetical protein [Microcoleus sp. FACHB-1515]